MIMCCVNSIAWTLRTVSGLKFTLEKRDVDYSYFLGTDYKRDPKPVNAPAVVVANHASFFDSLIVFQAYSVIFVSAYANLLIPIIGRGVENTGAFFVKMIGTKDHREEFLRMVEERIKENDHTPGRTPVGIFVEGTVTNN